MLRTRGLANIRYEKKKESDEFVALIRACAKTKDLSKGIDVHDDILRRGLLSRYSNALVTMYARCGAVEEAKRLLDMYNSKDVFTWTALMQGYVEEGQGEEAWKCFEHMQGKGPSPDVVTYVCILKACGSIKTIDKGERVHDQIVKQELLGKDLILCTALVDMYAKCGALTKAQQVVDELSVRDVILWNALITGYAQHDQAKQALTCLEWMKQDGIPPNSVTFICMLKAFATIGAVDKGEEVHNEIMKQGFLGTDVLLGTTLIDMYAKCGLLSKAQRVLEELPARDVVCWNALIAGYVQQGQGEQALDFFTRMQQDGFHPSVATFICTLKACGSIRAMDRGKQLHKEIMQQGWLDKNVPIGTALVDMYVQCGALAQARQVLDELPARNVVSWNALIKGYAQHGKVDQALNCIECMQSEGLQPDEVSFVCILKACGSTQAVEKGERIHDEIARLGMLKDNVVLSNALIDMYAKCGVLLKARKVLVELLVRDTISWNILITGLVQDGQYEEALSCLEQMQSEGFSPDGVTFICILRACGDIGAYDKGEQVHDEIARRGLLGQNIALDNALVDMYAKCGALVKAQQVLEGLPFRDVVSWSALIAGYVEHGQNEQALRCFDMMRDEGLFPDAVTFALVVKAFGCIGAADKGEQIHDEIARQGLLGDDIVLGTALADMYAKLGALGKSTRLLEELRIRDHVFWNTLIAGYAKHGQADQAWNCFKQMEHEGLSPNASSFAYVLNACSLLGVTEDAHVYLGNMSSRYGVSPKPEHYACMVDLLGRAGHLHKAVGLMQKVPFSGCAGWLALLDACRKWEDVDTGRLAFKHAIQLDGNDPAPYIIMASIFAAAGMHKDAANIEAMRIQTRHCRLNGGENRVIA